MKILHVITSLQTGGAEKLMVDLLPRLKDKGMKVELCLFDGRKTTFYDELVGLGVKIHSFGIGGNVYNPMHIVRLGKLIRKGGFDAVHTHNTAPQLFAAISSLFAKAKFFTTEHNTTNRRRNIKGFVYIDRWMYSRYSKVVCISDQAEINLREYLEDESSKICTIYNGVNVRKYADAESDDKLAEQFEGKSVVSMVAAFRPQKDQDTLIKAMALLPEEYHLLLVGDGERRGEIEESVKKLGLESRVHLLGLRNDVERVLKACDVVVMSSHWEGLSLSSIEGMACGKPFVASNVDGLREIVEGNGVLFEHENAQELAEVIKRLVEDEEYCKDVVRRCQEKAFQYDIYEMVKNYYQLYLKVVL